MHAGRSARRPGFAAVAIVSLALGIGGNTAVFGIVDSFVLHPFAFPDADRLLIVGPSFPKLSSETRFIEVLSPLEYEDFRNARSFARTAAFDMGNRNISGGDVPDRVFTAFLIDDPFPVIGLRPMLGRGFTAEELQPKGPPAAIISHRLWVSRFHSDRALVGKTIRVNGNAATLVGVMPPELLLLGTRPVDSMGRAAGSGASQQCGTSLPSRGWRTAHRGGMPKPNWRRLPHAWRPTMQRSFLSTPAGASSSSRSRTACFRAYGLPASWCWAQSRWCCSSPARTWRA